MRRAIAFASVILGIAGSVGFASGGSFEGAKSRSAEDALKPIASKRLDPTPRPGIRTGDCASRVSVRGSWARFRVRCLMAYPTQSVYFSRSSLDILIPGEKTQRIENRVGDRVGTIQHSGETAARCSISKTTTKRVYRWNKYVDCERTGESPFGRRFSLDVKLELNPIKPRGCPRLNADPWNVQVGSPRGPKGQEERVTYIFSIDWPGCRK